MATQLDREVDMRSAPVGHMTNAVPIYQYDPQLGKQVVVNYQPSKTVAHQVSTQIGNGAYVRNYNK